MTECKFCSAYKQIQKHRKTRKENWISKYYAQLVVEDYDKTTMELIEKIGYETIALKFCPYCGKEFI